MKDEELNEQMGAMIKQAIDTAQQSAPLVAATYKTYLEELVKQGFTREEAVTIIARWGSEDDGYCWGESDTFCCTFFM